MIDAKIGYLILYVTPEKISKSKRFISKVSYKLFEKKVLFNTLQ